VLAEVAAFTAELRPTSMAQVAGEHPDPFHVLIGTILSLRTQDRHTATACARLFAVAPDLGAMERLSPERLAGLIYPVGFYRTKAARILEICAALRERHGGAVPTELDALLALPGVGRKTANLTLTLGHGLPGICVDIHVHRITNRWGYVATRSPDHTELCLREILPTRYWIPINDWLVLFGQTVCRPLSPHCSTCRLAAWCARIGVEGHR
jgi:endonuclease-3